MSYIKIGNIEFHKESFKDSTFEDFLNANKEALRNYSIDAKEAYMIITGKDPDKPIKRKKEYKKEDNEASI